MTPPQSASAVANYQFEFGSLIIDRDLVAFFGRGEAALGCNAELVHVDILTGLFETEP